MQSASPGSRDLGYLPSVYSTLPHFTAPSIGFSKVQTSSQQLPGSTMANSSWERRSVRKHKRRTDDEGSSGKRRRLTEERGSDPLEYLCAKPCQDWLPECSTSSLSNQLCSPAIPQSPVTQENPSLASRVETDGSFMEVEAAQRRLQEIEDRITLEDDSDEDLDVEPAQRRPVLVLSDSLREGLQRGITDILPHTVAQSVSQSCMELVLWRPPEDPFTQQLKDSLQKQQRKQQSLNRQTPTPIPPPSAPLYCPPGAASTHEEDMEL
ncbi:coiled-coil domain-containing protein 117 [Trichomycterus rosablanca]|uniref:coiled-coil domain-containing protein 117 n=1 Tax=Trichomycterus rosablanca TaxID=2290929 RepID=UPI002F350C29